MLLGISGDWVNWDLDHVQYEFLLSRHRPRSPVGSLVSMLVIVSDFFISVIDEEAY